MPHDTVWGPFVPDNLCGTLENISQIYIWLCSSTKRIVRYVFILIMNKINAPKKVSENITSTKQYIFYTKHRQSVWVGVISCIIFDLPSSRYPDIPRGVLTDNSLIDIKTAPVYQACEIKPS